MGRSACQPVAPSAAHVLLSTLLDMTAHAQAAMRALRAALRADAHAPRLQKLKEAEEALQAAMSLAAREAHADGQSWTVIGAALGMKRQSALERFGRPVEPSAVATAAGSPSTPASTQPKAKTARREEVVFRIPNGWPLIKVHIERRRL